MNTQQEIAVQELREAVGQAFQKVAPIPQTDTSWWTTLFGEATQAVSSETQQTDVNVEELRASVREAFSTVASIPQTDTTWWTTLFGDDTRVYTDKTLEMPAYEEHPDAA